MKKLTLSPEEKVLISKLDIKQLRACSDISDTYAQVLVDLFNILLENEKEWFFTAGNTDEKLIVKKHYALLQNHVVMKRAVRLIQGAKEQLMLREEEKSKK